MKLKLRMPPLTQKQRKVLVWVSIPLAYFLCLFVFVRLTFPYDTLRDRILSEFNAAERERTLSIDALSGSGLFGVEAEGVTLEDGVPTVTTEAVATSTNTTKGDSAKGGDEQGPDGAQTDKKKPRPAVLHFDSIDVSVSLLSYLFGNLGVSFDARVGGGTIEGSFYQSDTVAKVQVEGQEVDISELTLLGKVVGLPLGGALTGHVELELPERSMAKAMGTFELGISNLTVGDGKAKVRNTIALPKLDAGTLALKATATDGKLDIETFGADGPDFEMKSEGKVRLRQPFDKSLADLEVAFRFKDAYKNKSDVTKSLFGSSDSKVPGLFDMDPTVRRAKDEEGFYRWKVAGLITAPSFRPVMASRRGKEPSTARSREKAVKKDEVEEAPEE